MELKNKHYGKCDPIDLMRESGDAESFCVGNIMKYLARRNKKNQKHDDLVKVMDYAVLLLLECGFTNDDILNIVNIRLKTEE